MKPRTTLILLVITAALFAYMYFYEKKQLSSEDAKRQAQNVVNISRDKIDGLNIQNGDDKIELRRKDNKWRLESPIKDQADSALIDSALAEIDSWQKDAAITAKEIDADKNRLNEYGLNKPKLRLKLLGQDAPPEIWFGKDAALENRMYVRFENSKETYVVSTSVQKAIDKKPDDFRDKRLTGLTVPQVQRLVLKTPAGEMELQKKAGHWELLRPLRARGDDQKIADLIAQITTAHIQQFVADDRGDLHPYGLAEPRGSITLFAENEAAPAKDAAAGGQGQMLQIGAVSDKQKDQVYVRSAARGFVYTLPKKIEELLNTTPNDLRDRHLVRFDRNNLDRITIDSPKGKIVLARKNETWTMANRNNALVNSSEAMRLIDTLSNEQVTKFVEDVASNLPKYGLDKPQLAITLSSFASENTAETKAGEQPFATISFGHVDGDNVYARVGEEPFILAVRKTLVDAIFTGPPQWQELAIFAFKPEDIHRVTVTSDKPAVEFVRGPNKDWKLEKGQGTINGANVQSLINILSKLHAVHWVGATELAQGLDKPQLTISFTTSTDDKATHKLIIGAATPNGMTFAHADGHDGTFLISNPDLGALRLPLTQAQAPPSPSASASVSPAPATSPTPATTL
jgi:hypothetical protein